MLYIHNLFKDKLWELDKSWENNLVFYGVKEEQEKEETSHQVEAKIREIIKIKLGITRCDMITTCRNHLN